MRIFSCSISQTRRQLSSLSSQSTTPWQCGRSTFAGIRSWPYLDGVATSGTYTYRAAHRDGSLESGVLSASSHAAAEAALAARELFPLELLADEATNYRRKHLPVADLALGLRMLASLLDSGLPIARALTALEDLAPPSWRHTLPFVRESVRDGHSLASALTHAPVSVPPLVIGIVRAGEAGSGLASAVGRAALLMERTAATRAALQSALTYPVILAVAGIASVALLVGVVLPRFAIILADLGQELPPVTRGVIAAAGFARASVLPAIVMFVITGVAWRSWVGEPAGRARWHAWLLRLPLLGPVRHSAATARTASSLAALLQSGVTVAAALSHAALAAGDAAVAERLLASREAIVRGERLSTALTQHDAVTTTAIRLVRAGEETGRLAAMLEHAATLEDTRAATLVANAVRLIEPAMIIAFGGLVALVAGALLQAVYSVRPL